MAVEQKVIDEITNDVKKFGDNITALNDNTKRSLEEMRALIDAQGKKSDPVLTERLDKFSAEIEAKTLALENGVKAVTEQTEKLEAVNKRPGAGWSDDEAVKEAKAAFDFHKTMLANAGKLHVGTKVEPDEEGYKAYVEAFSPYMRSRNPVLAITAAMQTGSDPDGGYLVPTAVDSRIIKRVYETSNLRGIAEVITIGGKELEIPRDEGEFGFGGWVGETTAPSETSTSQFGLSKIAVHEMFCEPRATQQLLEDAAFDVEGWISNKVGEKFGRIEATAFHTGNGVNMPRGFLTYAAGTSNGQIEQVKSGDASAIKADGIYDLVFSLKDYYLPNASFLMKRLTVRDIMKLKDGQGNYLWQMGDFKTGIPSTILGHTVNRSEDMPAIGAGSLPIVFGDMKAAYTIVDRLGITLLRDNLTAKPYIKFYNRRRVGGDVVNFEAIKLQVVSA